MAQSLARGERVTLSKVDAFAGAPPARRCSLACCQCRCAAFQRRAALPPRSTMRWCARQCGS